MSYPVNQRITPYQQQPTMGLNADPLQNVDTDKIVNDSPVTKATKQDNPALLFGVMAPTMAATAWGMSKFSASCRGEYSKSSLGKIEEFGNTLNNSKFFNNPVVEGIQKAYTNSKNFLNDKIIANNKILYAMFNTRSQPRNKMVLTMQGGIETELSSSAAQMLEKYFKADSKNKLHIKDAKSGIIREITKEEIEEIAKNSHKPENIEKIINICKQKGLNEAYRVEKTWKIPLSKKIFREDKYLSEMLGSFGKKVLGKEVYFSELANKLNAAKGAGKMAQKTTLGKALPRQVLRILEGLTNANTGGGAIAILMGSYIIADSIVKSIKAPRDEKGKTFAENMIYNLGWYLTMPLGIKAMHSVGGLQYIGMKATKKDAEEATKKDGKKYFSVEEYRAKLETLNKNAQSGDISKTQYDTEVKELKTMLKGETKVINGEGILKNGIKHAKNIIHKPLKFVGRVFTAGLESIRAYIPKGTSKNATFFKNLGFNVKNYCFGSPLRFITFMFLIAPFLGKLAAKCSHVVFGRPTKSVLDEGKEDKEAKKNKEAMPQPVMPKTPEELKQVQAQSQVAMQPIQQNNRANNQAATTQRENMLEMYNKTSPTNPNSQRTMTTATQGPVRTYIPSPEGVKIQPGYQDSDDAKVNSLMNKADIAEKVANKYAH